MNKRLHLLAAVSALALGASGASSPAAVQFAGVDLERCVLTGRIEADCACEAALEMDNPRYLALFFERYAHDGAENTACVALATIPVKPSPDGGYGG